MIVFTIYKNGGNAGAFGASFGCAVFCVRGGSGVNAGAAGNGVSTVRFGLPWRGFGLFGNWEGRMSAVCFGALYLTGAASYALTHPVRFWLSLLRAVRRSVAGALVGTEWIQSNAMKLRRECGCAGVRSRGTE